MSESVNFQMMSFTATVVKNAIRLPDGVHFPDGTRVIVESVDSSDEIQNNSLGQSLVKFVGLVDDLPPDLARNLDHYIHGHFKKP